MSFAYSFYLFLIAVLYETVKPLFICDINPNKHLHGNTQDKRHLSSLW